MKTADVSAKLDLLSEMRAKIERLKGKAEEQKDKLLGPLKAKLVRIEIELAKRSEHLLDSASALDVEIREAVVEIGETTRGEALMAVFCKGRANWSNDMLEGFALEHPELLKARTFSKPSVTIRRCKSNESD